MFMCGQVQRVKKELAAALAVPQRVPAKPLNGISAVTSLPKRDMNVRPIPSSNPNPHMATSNCAYKAANKATKAAQQKAHYQKAACICKRKREEDVHLDT